MATAPTLAERHEMKQKIGPTFLWLLQLIRCTSCEAFKTQHCAEVSVWRFQEMYRSLSSSTLGPSKQAFSPFVRPYRLQLRKSSILLIFIHAMRNPPIPFSALLHTATILRIKETRFEKGLS